MKTFSMLATVALLGFAPVAVQAHPSTPVQPVQNTGADAESTLDAAIKKFRELASRSDAPKNQPAVKAAYEEMLAALRQAYKALDAIPTTEEVRKRLTDAINDLYNRAHNAAIDQMELNELRSDALNYRVRNAIRQAIAAFKGGVGTPADIKRITDAMALASDAIKEAGGDLSELRARVQARADELTKKARIAATDFDAMDADISASIALAWELIAQHRAGMPGTAGGPATVIAVVRVKNTASDHFAVAVKADPALEPTQKQVIASIEKLQTKAASAPLSEADFQEVKTALTARVRATSK